MTDDTDTDDATRITIRTTIYETLDAADDPPTRPELIDAVTATVDAAEAEVAFEVDELERAGLVYLVGDEQAVRVP